MIRSALRSLTRSRRRPAARHDEQEPRLLLTGPETIREQVCTALSRLPVTIEQQSRLPDDDWDGDAGPPDAVVIVVPELSPQRRSSLETAAKQLEDQGIPIFVASRRSGDRLIGRALRQSGVSGLFRWPKGSRRLVDALRPAKQPTQ